jgi:hypothetical protein
LTTQAEAAALKEGEDQTKSAIKRSINLALSHRGQAALKMVGLYDEVMKGAQVNLTPPSSSLRL